MGDDDRVVTHGSGDGSPEEVRIADPADGSVEATVLPGIGARLHSLRAFGREVLLAPAGPGEHVAAPFFRGSFVMAPWANRVAAHPITVGGRVVALAPNFPDGSAIHGLVYAAPWERVGDGSFRVRGGGPGHPWPWEYEVRQAMAVAGPTLTLDLDVENRSTDPMPAGVGLHPWFVRPLALSVPARSVYRSNVGTVGTAEPVAGDTDLRSLAEPAPGLDATWTDLTRPEVELHWPRLGVAATLRADAATLCIVVANPAHLDATAVEPQTHAPYGIQRLLDGAPDAMALLAPGGVLKLRVGLTFRLL